MILCLKLRSLGLNSARTRPEPGLNPNRKARPDLQMYTVHSCKLL